MASLVNLNGFKRNVEKKGGAKICVWIIIFITLIILISVFGGQLTNENIEKTKEVRALICLVVCSVLLLVVTCYFIRKIAF